MNRIIDDIIYVPVPRTGSTSILSWSLGLNPRRGPLPEKEIPYGNGRRHPRLSEIYTKESEVVVVSVRNPIDRLMSIKRFTTPPKLRKDFSEESREGRRRRAKFLDLNGMGFHLVQRGYDFLVDMDVEVKLIRYENIQEDFKSAFNTDHELATSNPSEKFILPKLSYEEVDLLRKLNPFEWNLYDCDNDPRVVNLI